MSNQKKNAKKPVQLAGVKLPENIKPWMIAVAAVVLVLILALALGGGSKPQPQATQPPVITAEPTEVPTVEPTAEPTEVPTAEPTAEPTEEPTAEPTEEPTPEPTATPIPVEEAIRQAEELLLSGDYQQAATLLTGLEDQQASALLVECCANQAAVMLKQDDLKGAASLIFGQMDTIAGMLKSTQYVQETNEGVKVVCFHVTLNADEPTYDIQFVDAATQTRIAKAAFDADSGEMLSVSTYYPERNGFLTLKGDFSWEETIQRLGLAEPTAEPSAEPTAEPEQ